MLSSDIVQRLFRGFRRSEPLGFVASRFEIRFSFGQQHFGSLPGGEDVLEFSHVHVFAQPPIAGLLGQDAGQIRVEIFQRGDGPSRSAFIIGLLRLRYFAAQSLVDKIDRTVILFTRDAIPHFRRVEEVYSCLFEKSRNFLEPLNDVLIAPVLGCVFEDIRPEQCIARQFDVDRRIVFVALDRVQFEQREVQIILHDFKIRSLFFIKRRWIETADAA